MTGIAVQNRSGAPQVIDQGGHVLGAGEFAAVFPDGRTAQLLQDGDLIQVTGNPESAGLDAQAAAALRAAPSILAGDYGLLPSSPSHSVDGGTP